MAPPPSTPDKHPIASALGDIVHIHVGETVYPEAKSFKVHKGIITFYSGFFNSAFNGRFAESKTGTITLPDEEPDLFRRFMIWSYVRRLELESDDEEALWTLCRMWVFADRREIPMLMNECLNALKERVIKSWKVPSEQMTYIYENTTASSGLRRLVRFLVSQIGTPESVDTTRWNLEATRDILGLVWCMGRWNILTSDVLRVLDMCQYHEHEKDVKCPTLKPAEKPSSRGRKRSPSP